MKPKLPGCHAGMLLNFPSQGLQTSILAFFRFIPEPKFVTAPLAYSSRQTGSKPGLLGEDGMRHPILSRSLSPSLL